MLVVDFEDLEIAHAFVDIRKICGRFGVLDKSVMFLVNCRCCWHHLAAGTVDISRWPELKPRDADWCLCVSAGVPDVAGPPV